MTYNPIWDSHPGSDGSGHSDVAANTAAIAALSGGDPFTYLDLSGTYDWSANGSASVDPTSGMIAYWSGAAPTVLSVGSNKIIGTVQSGIEAHLYLPMTASLPMKTAHTVSISIRYKIVAQAANGDQLWARIMNQVPASGFDDVLAYSDTMSGGVTGKTLATRRYANNYAASTTVNSTLGHVLVGHVSVSRANGNPTANIETYSENSVAWVGGNTVSLGTRWWYGDGDSDNPVLDLHFKGGAGGGHQFEIYAVTARCY
jgi:hypothetical protein